MDRVFAPQPEGHELKSWLRIICFLDKTHLQLFWPANFEFFKSVKNRKFKFLFFFFCLTQRIETVVFSFVFRGNFLTTDRKQHFMLKKRYSPCGPVVRVLGSKVEE